MKKGLFLFIALMLSMLTWGQTVLISPTGDGGFETGGTLALNNWSEVNGATNVLTAGTLPVVYAGSNCAYSWNGTTWAGTATAAVNHIYRDVTFPAGESLITLSFYYKLSATDLTYDFLKAFLVPTTTTPVAGTQLAAGQIGVTAGYDAATTWTLVTITVPASAAGTTQRLVLSWKGDGVAPHAAVAIDNIQLTSQLPPTPFAGIYTINNTLPTSSPLMHDGSDNFASFTDAITALNVAGVSAAVTFNVTAGQTFAENTPIITATGTIANTITFAKLGVAANPVITPTGSGATNDAGITIAGGDYITFDGIDINANAVTVVEYGYYIRNASATDGAQNNIIRNLSINLNRNNTTSTCAGIYQNVATAPTNATGANSYNKYYDLTIQNATNGIYLAGNATYRDNSCEIGTSTCAARNTIFNIGPTTSTFVTARGIYVLNCDAVKIWNNDITNVKGNQAVTSGILLATYNGTNEIYNNKITDVANSGSTTSTSRAAGIEVSNSIGTPTIRIYNNFVSDVKSPFTGAATATVYAYGIYVNNTVTASVAEIDNNSVYLTATGSPTYSSSCFTIGNASTAIQKVRGNIFVNAFPAQGATAKHYCWYSTSATAIGAAGSVSDYNDLFVTSDIGTSGFIARGNATYYNTLATWQAITSTPDLNSVSVDPLFASTSNLHVNAAGVNAVAGFTPQAWIANDIDCQDRSTLTPSDLGADGFDPPSCVIPTALAYSAVTNNAATISWTASTSNPANGYDIYYSTSATAPDGATVPSASVLAGVTTYNMVSLLGSTTYYVWVRSNCGVGDLSAWAGSVIFTTACNSESIPTVVQTFESAAIPTCWSTALVTGTTNWSRATTNDGVPGPHNGTYFMGKTWTNSDALLFSQPIDMTTSASGARMNVWIYRNTDNDPTDRIRFHVNTTPSLTGATQLLEIFPDITLAPTVAAAGWYNYIVDIPASYNSNSTIFIIAQGTTSNGASAYGIGFDDFLLEPLPSCLEPSALVYSALTSNSATISWTASASAPANGYDYYVSTSTTAPDGATVPTGSVAAGVTTADLTLLSANTTYYYWVRSECGVGIYSSWAGYSSFYTGYCNPAPSSVDGDGIVNVTFGQTAIVNNTTLTETNNYGDYSAMIGDGMQYSTLNVDITYSTAYTYGTKIWVDWNNDLDFDDAGELMYTGLSTALDPTTLAASFVIAGTTPIGNYKMRIGGTDDNAGPATACYNGIYGTFEDYTLQVTSVPPCYDMPTALVASALTTTTATVSWTAPPTPPANGYQYYLSTTAAPVPDGTTIPTGVTAAGITNVDLSLLTENTSYYIWVRANCDDVNFSGWAGSLNFTTLANCVVPTALVSSAVTATTATVSWTASISAPANGYEYYVSAAALPVPDGATVPTGVTAAGITSVNLSSLTQNTAYYVWVRSNCDGTNLSDWAGALNFTTPFSCPAPSALLVNNILSTSAQINWTENGAATAWNIKASTVNFDPTVANGDFGIIPVGTNPYTTPAVLTPNTLYYYYIQANCGVGDESTWVAGTFTTACGSITTFPFAESFDGTVFAPSCWTNLKTAGTGTGTWSRVTSGSFPTTANHSGAGMTQFNCFSYSSGTAGILATPSIIVPDNTYVLEFWMYRDNGYLANADLVNVRYNSAPNLTGATLLGTVNRSINLAPVVAANGWYKYTYALPAGTNNIILEAVSAYGNNIFVDDVIVRQLSSANDIVAFSFTEQTGPATIDAVNHTVAIEVAGAANLNGLVPTIAVSPYATINPLTGVAQDFTAPFVYTVTAEDLTPQTWTVTVTNAITVSSANDILTFSFPQQTGPATIDAVNHTVAIEVAWTAALTSLTPTITVSPLATINPLSGVARDFSAAVTYDVTAEDLTLQTWTVTVTQALAPLGTNCGNPIVVTLPIMSPYTETAQTNCGLINVYSNTCLGFYDGGEDIIYRLDVTELTYVTISMTTTATYTGIALLDGCPDTGTCLDYSTLSGAGTHNLEYALPIGSYYLMADTWPAPNCIPSFDLTINASTTACLVPTALVASGMTTTDVTLNWTAGFNETAWNLIYGATGFDPLTTGTLVPNVTYPYVLTGLTEDTGYDVYVQSICTGPSTSAWSVVENFTTLASCPDQTGVVATVTGADVSIAWNAFTATAWNLKVSTTSIDPTTGTGDVFDGPIATNPYVLTSLPLNQTYYVYVQADCGAITGDWSTQVSFWVGYCVPSSASVDGTGITNVTFGNAPNIVNNTTAAETNNYGNYSAMIGDLQQTTASNVAITFNTDIYDYNTKIWIDFNNDMDFDDAGENVYTGTSSTTSPNTLNASVTIPLTAPLGNHRMRIGGGDMVVPTPCATAATWTCYEDYTVNVTVAPSCLAPTTLFADNITTSSAVLHWTEIGTATAWNLKASTTPIDPTVSNGDFGLIPMSANPFTTPAILAANTTYYWYLQSDCGGSTSAWVSGSFTTDCGALTTYPYFEGFEGTTFAPTCWANDTWEQSTWGTAHTGVEFAYSNLAGSTLTSPEFTIPATGDYTLSYWYRVESATYPQDAQISLSTDGVNFTNILQSFVGYTNATYVKFSYDLSAYAGQSIWVKFLGQTGTGGAAYGFLVDDVEIRETSDANDILTFSFAEQTGAAVIDAVNHTVAIEVALGTNPNGIIPTFTISPFATVDFASGIAQDFSAPFVYTVTSELGTPQAWTVNTTVAAALSDQNDILTFSFPEQTGPAVIDPVLHEVNIQVEWNANSAALLPTFTISPLATSNPVSGVAQDFSTPFTYVVTAQNLTTQDWVIKVAVAPIPAGANCTNPIIVNESALPYTDLAQANCGMGNDYANTCLDWYDGGDDIIYRLDMANAADVLIEMTSYDEDYTGIAILDACPDTGTCLDFSTLGFGTEGDTHSMVVTLAAGSYYIIIDTWPAPDCITNYDLSIEIIYPTIAGIDINSDVVDINVCQGTTEATAIADLATEITITDSDAVSHIVPLTWTIASYNANVAADYTATGTFTLPAGVVQTTPVATPLEVTAIITVDPATIPTFSFETVYCLGDVADLLPAISDNGVNGTWDIATINTATAGSVDYTFTANAGVCALPTVVSVTVNPIITPSFTFETTYCIGTVADLLPAASVEGVTGTWDIATINTAVAGTSDYTFTPDAGQCAVAAVVAVTINDILTPTFSFDTEYCVGDVADVLPATSVNGITGTWDIATISTAAAGNVNYTFTPDAGECAIPAIVSVTVNNLPVVTCPANFEVTTTNLVVLSGALPVGGEYTGTNVSLGEFDPDGLANGPYTITYTYTDITTGCSSFCDFIITLNVAWPEIDGIDVYNDVIDVNICQGADEATAIALLATEITITDVDANEFIVPLTWTIASFDGNTAGDYNATGTFVLPITVSQTTPATTLEVYAVVTVIANTVPAFTFETTYCDGATADVLPLTSDNGVTGTWAPAAINTTILGSSDYVFTPDGAICAVPVTISVTVNPIVTPAFSFETTYCIGATADLLPLTSDNGVTGTWDIATISTATVGSTDYTFTPDAGQCAIATVVAISVNDEVTPTFSFTAEYCLGELADVLPLVSDNGITGTWLPATITTATSGTSDYTFTQDAGQCAIGAVIAVTINDLPVVTCPDNMAMTSADGITTLTGATPAGGVYSGTNVTGDQFDPTGLAIGAYTITYTYTDPATGCVNSCDFTIDIVTNIINTDVAAIAIYPNPNNGIFTLNFSNVNGEVNYQIYDTKGSIIIDENIMTSGNTVKEVSINLVPGVYYVKLITETQTVVEKLVIE